MYICFKNLSVNFALFPPILIILKIKSIKKGIQFIDLYSYLQSQYLPCLLQSCRLLIDAFRFLLHELTLRL